MYRILFLLIIAFVLKAVFALTEFFLRNELPHDRGRPRSRRPDHPRAGGDHHVETRVPRSRRTQPFCLTVSNVAGKKPIRTVRVRPKSAGETDQRYGVMNLAPSSSARHRPPSGIASISATGVTPPAGYDQILPHGRGLRSR